MRSNAIDVPGVSEAGVGGEAVGAGGKRVATFGPGRVCEEEGCTTRLSTYNSRSRCAVHDFDPTLMNFRCPTPSGSAPVERGAATDSLSESRRHRAPAAGRRRRAA